jgi:hypothetical protein
MATADPSLLDIWRTVTRCDFVPPVRLRLYGVLSRETGELMEVFSSPDEASELVLNWDLDEPELTGLLEVVELELDLSLN